MALESFIAFHPSLHSMKQKLIGPKLAIMKHILLDVQSET